MRSFENARCLIEGRGIVRTNISFSERIENIGDNIGSEKIYVPENAVILPGFIDEHIHGAGGADAMDGTTEALSVISRTLAAEGTVGFLATTMTQSRENIMASLSSVGRYIKEDHEDGARLLGVHLEGPFIAEAYKGAQPAEYIEKPDIDIFDMYNAASGENIKQVTLAPELPCAGELISHLSSLNIVSSLGHTGAGYNDIERAVECGARCVTHTYNAQSPLHHREIGTVGSAMLFDSLFCEVIADTIHVSVPAIKLLLKNKTFEKLILITDAMRAKGLPDGESELGGQRVIVKNGEARLSSGTLAGSVLKMNIALKNMVEKVGLPLEKAALLASANPAKNLGIYSDTGSIAAGKRADLTVLGDDFEVLLTLRGGKIIYKA